ncbi:MAG: nucleotide exchange factor GrpE [Methanocalculus sp.]|uniref:nucleotide exchange factor GrpE n=1 Tax=Methanocalculus sp. TaxID=2004547 RepID=UPI00271B4546|nr:nucleotide exchange factor GrpE [Methanocalculus sp.]MDO9538558.1 nucleotide exchange factor GrpE [Methanocalculus sp.]
MEDDEKGRQEGFPIDEREGCLTDNQASSEITRREYDELNDKFLRLAADFENYKKRAAREQEMIIRFANERFALEILEILDNLERAVRADDSELKEGLNQIHKLFISVLERNGITPMTCIHTRFNPNEHEAIAYVPSEEEEGVIVDEVCHGYSMHNKVIRCAKVAVSKGKTE